MVRRFLLPAGIVLGIVAASVVAHSAYGALKNPPSSLPGAGSVSQTCMPQPCANVDGYVLWVSNVHVDGAVVHMTVKFQNRSSSTHASPEDLQLIDASRHASTPAGDVTGCTTWTRHQFSKSGDIFGPIDICFHVTNPSPPFTLRWSPDEGAFCCETDIKISGA